MAGAADEARRPASTSWRNSPPARLRVLPGSYFHTLAVAAQIQATGSPRPGSIGRGEMLDLLNARLVDAGHDPLPPAQRD
ncbi:MAG: hypothetical protein L0I76_10945 [Pseudonocardia sp.]|nr:hypothetical protein [Pseudonocardia sp.]